MRHHPLQVGAQPALPYQPRQSRSMDQWQVSGWGGGCRTAGRNHPGENISVDHVHLNRIYNKNF